MIDIVPKDKGKLMWNFNFLKQQNRHPFITFSLAAFYTKMIFMKL